jgi:protein gp37
MTDVVHASEGEARARVRKIREGFGDVASWILSVTTAFARRDWSALGYSSWEEYTDAEYADLRENLPPALRPQIAAAMRAENMDVRSIASAVGSSKSTVARELKSIDDLSQDGTTDRQVAMSAGRPYERSTAAQPASAADPLPAAVAEQIDRRIAEKTVPRPAPVMLTLRTHVGDAVPYPQPQSKATFNQTDGEGISWAAWSWNPVTGCLHGCNYCYARAIAHRFTDGFPVGFTPLFHHERLDAPAHTTIPAAHRDESHLGCPDGHCQICAYRRVFVCSMADLYGRWVPDKWIKQVHESMLASPAWEYLLLTKFPARYVGLDMPAGTWLGTSVDEQKRVRIAEDAFRQVDGVKVKWLSLEPLKEPLEFSDLSMFDWVVIGAQTETRQPDGTVEAFAPPFEWVARIYSQAVEAGCKVHLKPNLANGKPGMQLPNEYPVA